jgi:acetyltransferase-like isoleucine patch superfamily enzyme
MEYLFLDKSKLDKLRFYGLDFEGNQRTIPNDFICEIPCSLKQSEIGPKVFFGAFSYMVSGYIFATHVGRYCSIAENVQIGRQNHPTSWLSTSPFTYLSNQQIMPISNTFKSCLHTNPFNHEEPATVMQHTVIGNDVWIGHGAYNQSWNKNRKRCNSSSTCCCHKRCT